MSEGVEPFDLTDGIYFYQEGERAEPAFLKKGDKEYEAVMMHRCGHCGAVYHTLREKCQACGWPVPEELVRIIRPKLVGPHQSIIWSEPYSGTYTTSAAGSWTTAGSGVNTSTSWTGPSSGAQYSGMIMIRADDGDVQMEPFTTGTARGSLVTFSNTANTFFVNRKDGAIVDVQMNGTGTTSDINRIGFRVNGRDTGVQMMTAGIDSRVANRMPTTIPIAGGAALQIQVVS